MDDNEEDKHGCENKSVEEFVLEVPCGIDELCRLCCTSSSVHNDIFDPDDDLHSKMAFIQIQVRCGDGLPRRVCGVCRSRVLLLHQFCSEAQRAQYRLRSMLGCVEGPPQESPAARQERCTQTECRPETVALDASQFCAVQFAAADVKVEPLEGSPHWRVECSEPWNAESDDEPLSVFRTENNPCSTPQPNVVYAQELQRKRPGLQIKIKSENNQYIIENAMVKFEPDESPPETKRKRCRPRKNPIACITTETKKKIGRPKQNPISTSPAKPKRKPGRPKKTQIIEENSNEKEVLVSDIEEDTKPFIKKEEDSESGFSNWASGFRVKVKQLPKLRTDLYTCCICAKTVEGHKSCLEHYSEHSRAGDPEPSPPPPLPSGGRCPRCGKALQPAAWPKHWRRHWLDDRPPLRCLVCTTELVFARMGEFVQHGLTQHAKEEDCHGSERYMCEFCPKKYFLMKKLMQHRMLQHDDTGPLRPRCPRCNYASKSTGDIRYHIKHKHEQCPVLCPQCGKTFKLVCHLKRHVAQHSTEKPFKCRYCGKGFATPNYLPDHERTHTGEKPHACAFCGKGFSQRSARMTHERCVHSKERPFVCRQCGRGYAVKGMLTTHLKTCVEQWGTSALCVAGNLMDIEDMSSCDCPRDCDSRQYKSDMNVGNLEMLKHMTVNPFKAVKFNRSTSLMHFSFANSFYVMQKQETVMSLINLVSNLGGVFGLCLGCSIFGVLEILFFIYYVIKIYIKKYTLGRKRSVD